MIHAIELKRMDGPMDQSQRPFATWLWQQVEKRLKAGLSQADVARDMMVPQSSLSNWLNDKVLPMTPKSRQKIAVYFGVTAETVRSLVDESARLSPGAEETYYREDGRGSVRVSLDDLVSQMQTLLRQEPRGIMVPVVESFGAAGEGVVAQVERWPYIPTPEQVGHDLFGIRVKGNCLSPRLSDGYRAIIDKNAVPQEGDIVAFILDGESLLRILEGDRLVALNGHPPIPVTDNIHIEGVVVFAGKRP